MKPQFFINLVIFFLIGVAMSGCSAIEGDAGKAHYIVEPVIEDGVIVCCKVDILNAKDIGKVRAYANKKEDGTYEIILEEEGVNSSAPMQVMAEQNKQMMDTLLKVLLTAPVPGS